MRVKAVINRRAGSALDFRPEELVQRVEKVFGNLGHDVQALLVDPKEINAELDAAVAAKPDILIVGGGDGTVRSAAAKVLGSDTALAILPLGTVNRLAHDLNMPLTLEEALQALSTGALRKIDVAEVNGRIFLCNSLLGIPPEISAERQHLRGQSLITRISGYFRLLRTILASRKRIELWVDAEKFRKRVRVLSLAVSNNLYRREPALVFTRESLEGGRLGVYLAKPRSGLGLLWVLARAALGLWTGDSRLDSLSAKTVTIGSSKKSVRLSNDGEVETMDMPLHYRIRPAALTVLAPPSLQR